MPRPPLALGSWGKISRTPILRERVEKDGRTQSQDVVLWSTGGKYYRPEDLAGTAPIKPTTWVARARFRDFDGRTRKAEAWGSTGAEAERNLVAALTDRSVPSSETITADTRLSALWLAYRARLVEDGKALRTLDRYDYVGARIVEGLGGLQIREATTQRLDAFTRSIADRHGPSVAKTARVLLSGMFKVAVQFDAVRHNPAREVTAVAAAAKPARALSVDDLRALLRGVATSTKVVPPAASKNRKTTAASVATGKVSVAQYCRDADLADVITMFAATGCRISEVLAIRWSDVDLDAKTVAITGHVIRAKGRGLIREAGAKTDAGQRVLPLPAFAVAMLLARQVDAEPNPHDVVFPSQAGTLRDPDNCSKQWRRVRDLLGFPWVTSHSFRKSVATLIDDEGLSARIGADQLGHRQVSMTQDKYMGRGRTHTEVAGLLDRELGTRS